jgi:hypothetical protein
MTRAFPVVLRKSADFFPEGSRRSEDGGPKIKPKGGDTDQAAWSGLIDFNIGAQASVFSLRTSDFSCRIDTTSRPYLLSTSDCMTVLFFSGVADRFFVLQLQTTNTLNNR